MNAKKLEENFLNPDLKAIVQPDNSLKQMFVNYVGNKLQPENGDVTVEMIVEVLSQEFPEFLMVVAEENFMRGYEQALTDKQNFQNTKTKNKKRK